MVAPDYRAYARRLGKHYHSKVRHARPCAGHPRLTFGTSKDVDGRDKPGHDEQGMSV
jgi:hypothetical protein